MFIVKSGMHKQSHCKSLAIIILFSFSLIILAIFKLNRAMHELNHIKLFLYFSFCTDFVYDEIMDL